VLCLPHLDVDVLQLDYFTSSSRSAMRAVFSSWSLDESHLLSKSFGVLLCLASACICDCLASAQ
jgi:hypothetical protein